MSRKNKAARARQAGAQRRHRWWLWAIGLVVVGGVVWAVVGTGRPPVTRAEEVEYAPVTGPLTLPVSVATAPPEFQEIYEFAARRPDVLHYLPCFCGCWRAGHKSNYDCFVDEVRPDGFVDIDEMGFT